MKTMFKRLALPALVAGAVLLGAACEPVTCDKNGTCLIPPKCQEQGKPPTNCR